MWYYTLHFTQHMHHKLQKSIAVCPVICFLVQKNPQTNIKHITVSTEKFSVGKQMLWQQQRRIGWLLWSPVRVWATTHWNPIEAENTWHFCDPARTEEIHNSSSTLSRQKRRRKEDRVREWGWRRGQHPRNVDFHLLRGVRWTGMAGLVQIKALSPWLEVTAEQGGSDVAGEIQCELSVWRRLRLNASLWFSDKVISRWTLMGQSFPLSMDGWTLIKNSKGTSLFLESKRQTLSN